MTSGFGRALQDLLLLRGTASATFMCTTGPAELPGGRGGADGPDGAGDPKDGADGPFPNQNLVSLRSTNFLIFLSPIHNFLCVWISISSRFVW